MEKKEYTGILVAKISKKEVEKKHPEFIKQYGMLKFLTNEIKEDLKNILIKEIGKKATEKKYSIIDLKIFETEDNFVVLAVYHPTRNLWDYLKLKIGNINPEEQIKKLVEKVKEIEFIGYSSEGILTTSQQNGRLQNL